MTLGEYRDNQRPFTSVHEFELKADEYINDFHIRFETEVTEIGLSLTKEEQKNGEDKQENSKIPI